MSNSTFKRIVGITALVLGIALATFLVLAYNSGKPVLFYLGSGIEVPDGTAISIMNPFRDRTSELTAQNLIKDLRSSGCKKIVRDLHSDPNAICPTLQENRNVTLVWREDSFNSRLLVYRLQRQNARIWIKFDRYETGFAISSLALAE
jgi:hypothetical protein